MKVQTNPQTTHWEPQPYSRPVCGIAELSTRWMAVCTDELRHMVTCDHCLAWIAKQGEPATLRDVDERVINMTFNNADVNTKIEEAIERGIKAGLEKVKDDFFRSPTVHNKLHMLVANAVETSLQRASVRQNLVGIHKIAEDEIDAEWDRDNPDFEEEAAEKRQEETRQALRDVLSEAAPGQTGAGVGTTFVQNISSPDPLTPRDIYMACREAQQDHEDETEDAYAKFETELMQKAVASVVTADEFQDLLKRVVKVAIDERETDEAGRRLDYDRAMDILFFGRWTDLEKAIVKVEKPLVHWRRLYTTDTWCGADGESIVWKTEVTCGKCKAAKAEHEANNH